MNRGVCNNLMRDCFPYLNATNLQGKNMLDMKRMKKFQKQKDDIQKKLAQLKKKIAESEDQDEIIEALEDYQEKLQNGMKLKKEDFTGEAAEDFKYGFKMPLRCVNATNCDWICQKMIKVDGVADEAVESEQNLDVEELEADEDQQFETDLVIVDDEEEEDEEEEDDEDESTNDTRSNDTAPVDDARRILAAETVGLLYDDAGYQADDDTFEAGVSLDEPALSEEIVVPEDSVDSNSGSSSGSNMWMYIGGAVLLLVLIAGAAFIFKNRKDAAEFEQEQDEFRQTQMTQAI